MHGYVVWRPDYSLKVRHPEADGLLSDGEADEISVSEDNVPKLGDVHAAVKPLWFHA